MRVLQFYPVKSVCKTSKISNLGMKKHAREGFNETTYSGLTCNSNAWGTEAGLLRRPAWATWISDEQWLTGVGNWFCWVRGYRILVCSKYCFYRLAVGYVKESKARTTKCLEKPCQCWRPPVTVEKDRLIGQPCWLSKLHWVLPSHRLNSHISHHMEVKPGRIANSQQMPSSTENEQRLRAWHTQHWTK